MQNDPFRVDQDARRRWIAARDLVRADCPRVVLPAVDVDPDDPRVPPAARRAQAAVGGRLTYAVALVGRRIQDSGTTPLESVALRLSGAVFVWHRRGGGAWCPHSGAARPPGCAVPLKLGITAWIKLVEQVRVREVSRG